MSERYNTDIPESPLLKFDKEAKKELLCAIKEHYTFYVNHCLSAGNYFDQDGDDQIEQVDLLSEKWSRLISKVDITRVSDEKGTRHVVVVDVREEHPLFNNHWTKADVTSRSNGLLLKMLIQCHKPTQNYEKRKTMFFCLKKIMESIGKLTHTKGVSSKDMSADGEWPRGYKRFYDVRKDIHY